MRMRTMSTLFLASATGLLSSGVYADVLEVAADGTQDYVSIQAAIDAAATGDTILVYPGSYSETVTETDGKSLQIRSTRGPAATVISGASAPEARVVTLSGDGTGQFRGFTVRDGHGISSSGYAISACIVESNGLTGSMSAAIDLGAGSSLSGCVVRDNVSATTATCAGAYLGADGISVTSCLFDRNEAAPGAGAHAVYANGSVGGVVSGCVLRDHGVSGNVTLYVDGGSLEVRESTFCLNWVDTGGTWTDGGGNTFASSCPPFNDCDLDGVPDEIQLAMGDYADCNENGVVDACDLADGTLNDADGDGVPDECAGVTWTVDDDGPADFATIQEAIDASGPGDTILVLPGTYQADDYFVINIPFERAGALRIESRDGPEVTILSNEDPNWTAVRVDGESLVLDGFTILTPPNDWSIDGTPSSSFLLRNCVLVGGGMSASYYIYNCDFQGEYSVAVSVSQCTFLDSRLNVDTYIGCPTVVGFNVSFDIDNCLFDGSSLDAYSYGVDSFEFGVRDCTFRDVSGTALSMTLDADSCLATIESCLFDECTRLSDGDGDGGAIQMSVAGSRNGGTSSYTVQSCQFDRCAADFGGGISLTERYDALEPGVVEVVDCTFTNCYATASGGAMYLYDLSDWAPVLRDCTFNGCIAELVGAAVGAADVDLVVEGGSFTGNLNDTAAGLNLVSGNLDMTGTSFSDSRGSALRLVLSDAVLDTTTFTGSDFFGGVGIEQIGSTLTLTNGIVRGNIAGILNNGFSTLEVGDTVFCDNQTDIQNDSSSTTIDLGGNVFDGDCAFNTPGDLNGDGCVDGEDLLLILSFYNDSSASCPSCDLDGDGLIDGADLTVILGAWTGCQ